MTASLNTLATFDSTDGAIPVGGLITDSAGDLFGTTDQGGASGDGTVFEIADTPTGYSAPQVIASFNSTDGAVPIGGLITDSAGDLFGTTVQGGASNDGTVFEIADTPTGYSAPQVLVSFDSTDGAYPESGLITDSAGDLFGTTEGGGAFYDGTVFEIADTPTGYSAPQVIASFDSHDGAYPESGLITDSAGDLFGTTSEGGASEDGTVFEIAKTSTGYSAPQVLASFDSTDGAYPQHVNLITDSAGDLFGTTQGGEASDYGTVFEIAKTPTGYSAPQVLASFDSADGAYPEAGLITDSAGDLFGTTDQGGASNDGTVFEIAKTSTGYSAPQVLVSFNGTDGANPESGLITDSAGDLFGTTTDGGASNDGTVFEVTGLCYLSGTRLLTPTGEKAIDDLSINDTVVTRFGGFRPIRWIGRQRFDGRFARRNPDKVPVRIRVDALGPGMPARDLYVSPGHSMLIDDVLVLAQSLVNGETITQDWTPDLVDYYQIDLGTHDCIVAEGTWSESFADGPGLREQFHNVADFQVLYPDHEPTPELRLCASRPERGPSLGAALHAVVARASIGVSPGPLQGFIDRIERDKAGRLTVEGWAFDEAHPALPVVLDVLLGDHLVGTVLACDLRDDLKKAGKGQGRCSFAFSAAVESDTSPLGTVHVRRSADQAPLVMTGDCSVSLGLAA